jgi:hypothetical protein
MVFPYDAKSKDNSVKSLVKALNEFLTVRDAMSKEVLPGIEKLIKHNSAATYMHQIVTPYPELQAMAKSFKA